jgi:hypothetical protein
MRRDVFMSDISHYKRVIGDALHSRSEGGRRRRQNSACPLGFGTICAAIGLRASGRLDLAANDLYLRDASANSMAAIAKVTLTRLSLGRWSSIDNFRRMS